MKALDKLSIKVGKHWIVAEKLGQVYYEVSRYKRKQDAVKLLAKLRSNSNGDYTLVSVWQR